MSSFQDLPSKKSINSQKGTPRLINLLCDRSLLGGFVDQTFHIDKRIVKKAKKSLLGEEPAGIPSRALGLLGFVTPLRIFLVIALFLVASMTLSSQSQFHPAHIQKRGEMISQSLPSVKNLHERTSQNFEGGSIGGENELDR